MAADTHGLTQILQKCFTLMLLLSWMVSRVVVTAHFTEDEMKTVGNAVS